MKQRSDWAINKNIDKRIKELGGGGGMAQHSNEYHDPDMALGTHNHDSTYVNEADHTKTAHDALAIGHTSLTDKGTNTHAQVDTHLGAAAPHSGHALDSEFDAHVALTTTAHGGVLASTAFVGLAKITVGTSAPGSPGVGDLWCDTN